MSVIVTEIRPGAYFDSVVLMQLQRALAALPAVLDAGVVMATPANKDLLAASEMMPATPISVTPDDLLIAIKAETEDAARDALVQVDALLQARRRQASAAFRPRSLASAVKMLPDAAWVLVSVPGRYAAGVARDALDLGKHVFLYSDNVAVADEVALKETAVSRGLLLLGPDCGTAIINGVGLGFANRVRPGAIGLVGASGTGLQAISSHVHQLGGGISQAIGTGGRDLSAEVGGLTTLQALDLLGRDPETAVLVLVSKPPAPHIASRVLAAAAATGKPVVVDFIGYPPPARQLGNLHFAANLREAAELAVELQGQTSDIKKKATPLFGFVRGLFSGGTLAYEAVLGLQALLAPLYSNVPVRAEQKLADPLVSQAHTILDLGDDVFTQGRLHPMMDNDLRLRRLRQEAADPETGLILLDVVLGEGAHPNPAAELAMAIARVRAERPLPVLVILLGTDADPQNMAEQAAQFAAAGAEVFADVTGAVAAISQRVAATAVPLPPPIDLAAFRQKMPVINVGLASFYESVTGQGVTAVQVDWRPPAGGNEKMMALLAKMKGKETS